MELKDLDTTDWTEEDYAAFYDAQDGANQSDEQYWREQMEFSRQSLYEAREKLREKEKERMENIDEMVKIIMRDKYLSSHLGPWARKHIDMKSEISDLKEEIKRLDEVFESNRSEYYNILPEHN